MSKYTTEVRFICETASGLRNSEGYNSVNDILTKAIPYVFDFEFPIFDENYRSVLERKILKHFYTREIGEETVGLWKLRLDTRLNEIMPYYNKLYESELINFDPMIDTNYTRSGRKDTSGRITDDGNSSGNNTRTDDLTNRVEDDSLTTRTDDLTATRTDNLNGTRTDNLSSLRTDNLHTHSTDNTTDKYSDTPQGGLTGIANDKYLTNARMISETVNTDNTGTQTTDNTGTQTIVNTGTQTNKNTGTQTNDYNGLKISTNTGNVTNTSYNSNSNVKGIQNSDDYFETITGKVGASNYAEMLLKFRETFLNIDLMIINNLEDLFIQLW